METEHPRIENPESTPTPVESNPRGARRFVHNFLMALGSTDSFAGTHLNKLQLATILITSALATTSYSLIPDKNIGASVSLGLFWSGVASSIGATIYRGVALYKESK